MAQDEVERLERKSDHDPADPKHRLQLVKEIVAMANASGGVIRVGERVEGVRPGISEVVASHLDPARLCDVVDSFIAGEHLELTQSTLPADSVERVVVELVVPRHPRPPLVFTKDGTYRGASGRQETIFRRGDIYVRKGTKAEPAGRVDVLRWIDEAVEAERDRWRSRVTLVAQLPPDAELSFTRGLDVDQDEPAAILSRAVPIWKRDPSKLLSGQELATLLLVGDALAPGADGKELIVQSALRRRPSLWHWLTAFAPTPAQVERSLLAAIGGSDRDKSDAGEAIVDVAALMLAGEAYANVLATLKASSYAHFREAAARGEEQERVLERLRELRLRELAGDVLVDLSDGELRSRTRELATLLMERGRHTSESRKLGRLGLEMIARSPLGRQLAVPPSVASL